LELWSSTSLAPVNQLRAGTGEQQKAEIWQMGDGRWQRAGGPLFEEKAEGEDGDEPPQTTDGRMAKRHECLNPVIKLYRFFTVSLPDFDFDVGKAGIEEKQKMESRKLKWGRG
jgi:hypothetical protein